MTPCDQPLRGIEISDSTNNVLVVSLGDLFEKIEPWGSCCQWHLLHLWAVGTLDNNRSMLDFESEISASESGLQFSWEELKELAKRFEQVIDGVFVGDEQPRPVRRQKRDLDLYREHDFVIEVFDSSYWRVVSRRPDALKHLEMAYKDIRYCPPW